MKEGTTNHRKPKSMSIMAWVAPKNNDLDLNERKEDDVLVMDQLKLRLRL
jgi:hypothetical protein